jgi:hypothetical protein
MSAEPCGWKGCFTVRPKPLLRREQAGEPERHGTGRARPFGPSSCRQSASTISVHRTQRRQMARNEPQRRAEVQKMLAPRDGPPRPIIGRPAIPSPASTPCGWMTDVTLSLCEGHYRLAESWPINAWRFRATSGNPPTLWPLLQHHPTGEPRCCPAGSRSRYRTFPLAWLHAQDAAFAIIIIQAGVLRALPMLGHLDGLLRASLHFPSFQYMNSPQLLGARAA